MDSSGLPSVQGCISSQGPPCSTPSNTDLVTPSPAMSDQSRGAAESPPSTSTSSSTYWPTNGSTASEDTTVSDVLSEGLAQVSMSSHPSSTSQMSQGRSPVTSGLAFGNTSGLTTSSVTSNYWSTGPDDSFLNGGPGFSPGYSSGGSSSGSPQSPLLRSSRPITGGYKQHPQQALPLQQPQIPSMFASKPLLPSQLDNQRQGSPASAWKTGSISGGGGGGGGWPPQYSLSKQQATTASMITPSSGGIGLKDKDPRLSTTSGQISQSQFYGQSYRPSPPNTVHRSNAPSFAGRVPLSHHQQQQQQPQQEMGWPSGLGGGSAAPGGWGGQSLNFHAARKFGRRRGKSPFFTSLEESPSLFDATAGGDNGERFSRKVFVGGLPPDIDEEEITASFRRFGPLVVDWPHKAESKSYFPPKGYAFLLFQDESSVQALIDACINEEDKLYLCVSSPTIKDKPVQIRPWRLSDADFVLDASMPLDPRKTVFVGGVPRPLKAVELAMIMDRLYGGVCYAGIDTDPELKYPKGAGRVAFSNQQSYIAAISARFVQLQHGDIEKRVEVKPYVLDDQICDECQGTRCGGKFAPFFCANVTCLQYYCEHCWATIHNRPGREYHKPLVKEGADRPRAVPFRWC